MSLALIIFQLCLKRLKSIIIDTAQQSHDLIQSNKSIPLSEKLKPQAAEIQQVTPIPIMHKAQNGSNLSLSLSLHRKQKTEAYIQFIYTIYYR
nr:hypothetical protein [Spiroplasma sp. Moj]